MGGEDGWGITTNTSAFGAKKDVLENESPLCYRRVQKTTSCKGLSACTSLQVNMTILSSIESKIQVTQQSAQIYSDTEQYFHSFQVAMLNFSKSRKQFWYTKGSLSMFSDGYGLHNLVSYIFIKNTKPNSFARTILIQIRCEYTFLPLGTSCPLPHTQTYLSLSLSL